MNEPAIEFLHRLDGQSGKALWVETDASRLRAAAFLDGRTHFWAGERVRDLTPVAAPVERPRYIFHGAFCGSTLLARILDWPGTVLSLREPQAYVDVANGKEPARYIPHLSAAMAAAAGPDVALIKPTNWANNLIPLLTHEVHCSAAVFLSMDIEQFLTAVLRGGRDRLAFVARVAAHLVQTTGKEQHRFARAGEGGVDSIEHILRMAAVLHHIQEAIFREAMLARGWGADHWIRFSDLARDPAQVAARAARCLNLPIPGDAIAASVQTHARHHAKDSAQPFAQADRDAHDRALWQHHGATITRVCHWAKA